MMSVTALLNDHCLNVCHEMDVFVFYTFFSARVFRPGVSLLLYTTCSMCVYIIGSCVCTAVVC